MKKLYIFKLPSHFETIFNKARLKAEENKVSFLGDMDSGKFSGKGFEGDYHVVNGLITFTITKKPFIVPWSLIENSLKKYFV